MLSPPAEQAEFSIDEVAELRISHIQSHPNSGLMQILHFDWLRY